MTELVLTPQNWGKFSYFDLLKERIGYEVLRLFNIFEKLQWSWKRNYTGRYLNVR